LYCGNSKTITFGKRRDQLPTIFLKKLKIICKHKIPSCDKILITLTVRMKYVP